MIIIKLVENMPQLILLSLPEHSKRLLLGQHRRHELPDLDIALARFLASPILQIGVALGQYQKEDHLEIAFLAGYVQRGVALFVAEVAFEVEAELGQQVQDVQAVVDDGEVRS
jgi:hypothetical protein